MNRLAFALLATLLATACHAEAPATPAASAAPAAQQTPAPSGPAEPAASQATPTRVAQATTAQPATNARWVAGQHYRVLNPAQPTNVRPGKVEVAEVFWYGCPHCYTLESHLQAWKAAKPEAAELVHLPAALNPGWQPHARLYYAAQALGVLDQAHTEIFREMHVNRNPLNSLDAMVAFLGRFGVSAADAREALTSFAVETEVRRADAQVRRYRLDGVPAIIVNGKYVVGAGSAGGFEQLFELVNYLVALEAGTQSN